MADEKSSGLSVKVNVDVSEALRGLKALQREARKAAAELAEMSAAYSDYLDKRTKCAEIVQISGEQCFSVKSDDVDAIVREITDRLRKKGGASV